MLTGKSYYGFGISYFSCFLSKLKDGTGYDAGFASGPTTAANSAVRIRVGSRWRVIPRDAGGGIVQVSVDPRLRVPETSLTLSFGGHLNTATTNGFARASRDKSIGEN